MTRRGDLNQVLEGIEAARKAGLTPIKINSVVIKDTNDDEIIDLVEYCRRNGFEIRFIEYMDVGNSNNWSMANTVSKRQILDTIEARYPLEEIGRPDGRAPAEEFRFKDGLGAVGIIGSVTEPFCGSCSRGRLTADGRFVTCLFFGVGIRSPDRLFEGAPRTPNSPRSYRVSGMAGRIVIRIFAGKRFSRASRCRRRGRSR